MKYLLFALSLTGLIACAQTDKNIKESPKDYDYEVIAKDIPIPWGFDFLPDGSIIVTEKSGQLYHIKDKNKTEITGFPEVYVRGQGGLMDVKIHPKYPEEPWIYATYAKKSETEVGGNTRLVRFQINNNSITDLEVLYQGEQPSKRGQHFGSRIEFDRDGYLYFSIGDRGNRDENPQDITRDNGKIYRLHDDGNIPEDNPFVDEVGAKKAIYSYGHRNPQGMDTHPETGEIWTHEHGPRGGDEVNLVKKGENYGWPIISFGINYSGTEFAEDTARAGMMQPDWYWDPSIAPSGMEFVTGDTYPEWKGQLLVGSLKFNYLVLCRMENNTITGEELLFEGIGRVRSVEQGPDGYIYVGTEGNGIVRIVPKEN